jgi:uncharacterized protein with gpF-like domain
MPKLRSPTGKPIVLRAIRPNAGIEAAYRKELQSLIADMANSVRYWMRATWRANPPRTTMAQDASPILELRKAMERLGRHWTKRFDKQSEELARRFADKSVKHTNVAMQQALKEAGFVVPFKQTAGVTEALQATIGENVALIKSIPAKYLGEVQQQVWQSVAAGHDLDALTKALQSRFGVTYKRAAFIARDQNAKANAVMKAARQQELGLTQAIWVHSGAGKEPRESHVKAGADKLVFDINKGAYLDGKWTWPGMEINCRCTDKAIIPGWED